MLVQFSVENVLSFDEEQVFSMVATSGDQHPAHLVPDVPRKGASVLRAAALYGANGAGKSNLVQAIRFAKNLIVEGTRGTQPIAVRPFKLGSNANRPSKFEFIIKTQGVLYNYGFRLDSTRIHEEWLYATPNKQEVKFFERTTSEDGKADVEVGPSLSGRSKQKQFLQFVAQGTRQNQLFLTEALERNVAEVKPVTSWFQKSLLILSAEASPNSLEMGLHEDEALTDFLQAVLRNIGTGIDEVSTKEVNFDFSELPQLVSHDLVSHDAENYVRTQLADSNAVVMNFYGPQENRVILKKGEQEQIMQVLLRIKHRGKNGQLVEFNMDEQSDGTQRLINLVPALFMLKQDSDQVLIIDELDRRLHPYLSRFLVQTALECDEEHRQSQLIFTTHDTNLLDLDLLRRDEIWFAEKDKGGASHLYSLAEFKTRPDLKIEKGYLNGRFGAIPFIGDIHRLDETVPKDGAVREPEPAGVAA